MHCWLGWERDLEEWHALWLHEEARRIIIYAYGMFVEQKVSNHHLWFKSLTLITSAIPNYVSGHVPLIVPMYCVWGCMHVTLILCTYIHCVSCNRQIFYSILHNLHFANKGIFIYFFIFHHLIPYSPVQYNFRSYCVMEAFNPWLTFPPRNQLDSNKECHPN